MIFKRIDKNQPEIVKAFRQLGCQVAITSSVGHGFPDLIVGRPAKQKLLMVEIKDGSKPPSARKLTQDEETFRDAWAGSYVVVESISDAVRTVSLYL